MADGLLHLGSMAVLIGIAYLSLEKIDNDPGKFEFKLKQLRLNIGAAIVILDKPADAGTTAVMEALRVTRKGLCALSDMDLTDGEKRAGRKAIISDFFVTLRTLRREYFLRYVGKGAQPEYPYAILAWFWADRSSKAPGLPFIASGLHGKIVTALAFFSALMLFNQVGLQIFDEQSFGPLPFYVHQSTLFWLYVGAISFPVICAFLGHKLMRVPPRCERYLGKILDLKQKEDERDLENAKDEIDSFSDAGDNI